MKWQVIPLIILLNLVQVNSFSQNEKHFDSLNNELMKYEAHKKELGSQVTPLMDSTKVNILNDIVAVYWNNNHEKAMDYTQQCLTLAERIGYKKGIAKGYNDIGVINIYSGNNLIAIDYFQKALKIRADIGDRRGVGLSYMNIGVAYRTIGNLEEALKYHLLSLKIMEEIGDKKSLSNLYSGIGNDYNDEGNYEEALKYYQSALKIFKETGNMDGIGMVSSNLGSLNLRQGKYQEALNNYIAAKNIHEEGKDWNRVSEQYNNLGMAYGKMENYPEALNNFFASVEINKNINDKEILSTSYINIGEVYERQDKLNAALNYEKKGLAIALETGSKEMIRDAYGNLTSIDSAMGNFKGAFENHKLYILYQDSLFNIEKEKKFTQMQMQYEFDKIQDSTKAAIAQKDALAMTEINIQKQRRNYAFAGMGIIIAFSVVVIIQRNKIAKVKKQKALEVERARISRDLHDDLGSALTRVAVLSQMSGNNPNDKEKLDENLSKIKSISHKMTAQLNELVWSVNPAHDKLQSLLGYIHEYAAELLEENAIEYRINFPENIPDIAITPEFRMTVYSITKEALNNAIKYAESKEIEINFILQNGNEFLFSIADNGKGFDSNVIREFGNGIKNMRQRAKDSGIDLKMESRVGEGTKIILKGSVGIRV